MIDPVTLAVLQGRLEQIADEMDALLFRSAFNPTIAEAHDAAHGLYDAATGATLVQGKSGLPIFVAAMAFAVRAVIEHVQTSEPARDGDIFLFNDPYLGGTHLSDVRLVRPFFWDGQLFCWLASVGHWHDVGGAVPGNYNPSATDCFQEGFVVPPIRLVEGGRLRKDLVALLEANSRTPLSARGDLEGQLAALDLGARRLRELLDTYGAATVREALVELRRRAAQLLRAEIRALPDGRYRAVDFLDNDGISAEALRLELTLEVQGDRLHFDFSGSAQACRGPLNIARATTIAGCYVALKHVFREVPANAGVLEPIDFTIPEGSIFDARPPVPVGGYTETVLRLIDLVFQALAQAAPERTNGCAYGTINALSISGPRPEGGRFVLFSFFGGGHGGHPLGDGLQHGNAPISTATIPPVEILEAAYPIAFTRWALRPDSGGPGRHRGGLGAIYELELLAAEADLFLFGDRGRFPPPGVVGGQPAAPTRFAVVRKDGREEPQAGAKCSGIRLQAGDRVRLETPGGGGYGDPWQRPLAAVERDLELGYVTRAAAQAAYGVVFDADGRIDPMATAARRAQPRAHEVRP